MRIEKIVSNKEELLRLIPDGGLGAEIGNGHFTESIRDHLPSTSALCTSVKSLKKLPDEFFDWIYLNSDIETFKEDLNVCSKKVKVGGLVCGSNYRHGGDSYAVSVRSVMHKLLDDHDFNLKYLTDENDGNLSFAVSKQGSIPPLKSLLIFVHYNREEPYLHLPEYVKKYVKTLMPFFTDTVISSNYKGPEWNGVPIMRFENLGYDFGFFYQALQNIELGEYERIAFVNDSNEVVRLGSFNDIFEWANQEENELWGVTDADLNANGMLGRKYHIQSHFLVFEKKGIELLSSFFEDINFEEDYLVSPKGLRNRIIKNCEIGLTQYFLKNGLKAKSYFSVNDAKCPNPMFLNCQLNVHVSKWKELVDSGYPLIKRKIISGYYSGALNNWKKHRDYLDNPNFLNVATPCSRPENLLKMATSIKENLDKNYCWHIVFDEKIFNSDRFNSAEFEDVKNKIKSMLPDTLFYRNKSSGKAGHCHRNYILDIIEKSKGWIYFNDDDNIMSEDFRSIQGQLDLSYPVVVLSQKNHDGKIRCVYRTLLIASPENMKVHKVDTAQLIYNLDYIDGQRFEEDYNEADGMFAEEFYNKHKKALFLKDKFCYYNFLRPY